jgi:hypothetical protein
MMTGRVTIWTWEKDLIRTVFWNPEQHLKTEISLICSDRAGPACSNDSKSNQEPPF